MKIIVDAMGGDNAPLEIVKGAIDAVNELGAEIMLVGSTEEILRCVQSLGMSTLPKGLEIFNCREVITMEDDPARAVREKKDSSMSVMLRKLKDGEADAAVSAGSTGALLSGATLVVKRIRGIRRAALAPILPTDRGGCVLIDCGANAECSPEYLLQFAFMGESYARLCLDKPNPRVGLLNIGGEEGKGTALQKETYQLLKQAHEQGKLNFVGNVESRDVLQGAADVLVADGFSGNVLLKAIEGTAMYMTGELKKVFYHNTLTKLAALLVKGQLRQFRRKLDYEEVGGTVFLGITRPVVKAHGSSKAKGIRSAINQAMKMASAGLSDEINKRLADMVMPETEGDHV